MLWRLWILSFGLLVGAVPSASAQEEAPDAASENTEMSVADIDWAQQTTEAFLAVCFPHLGDPDGARDESRKRQLPFIAPPEDELILLGQPGRAYELPMGEAKLAMAVSEVGVCSVVAPEGKPEALFDAFEPAVGALLTDVGGALTPQDTVTETFGPMNRITRVYDLTMPNAEIPHSVTATVMTGGPVPRFVLAIQL